jgi:hypothetical protein
VWVGVGVLGETPLRRWEAVTEMGRLQALIRTIATPSQRQTIDRGTTPRLTSVGYTDRCREGGARSKSRQRGLTAVSDIKGLPHLLPLDELLRLREPQKWTLRPIWGLASRRAFCRCTMIITPDPYIYTYIWGDNQRKHRRVINSRRKRRYL